MLSKLTHPRIVRVFDFAIEPKSQMPYFVMDLVLYEDGESHMVEDVAKSDIAENFVGLRFKDVAEALDYIHAQIMPCASVLVKQTLGILGLTLLVRVPAKELVRSIWSVRLL